MKTLELFFTTVAGLILILTSSAHAQNMVSDLDEKFHLEKAISERLEQTLKTRLEKDYFDITVEARLKRKGVNVKVRDRVNAEVSSEELQKWYSNQMRTLSRQIASAEGIDTARPFELESLVVTLGLSDRVEPQYREELKTWLQKWVEASFASKGEAVILVRPSNIVQKNDFSQPSGLSRYQNLLGMMFLGLVFGTAFFFQHRRNRPANSVTSVVVAAAADPVVAPMAATAAFLPEDAEQKELIRTLKMKIAWVSPGMRPQVDGLISKWCDSEEQSYLKVAAYLEALAEGGSSLNESARASVPVLPNHAHAALPKALTHLQELETSVTLSLYQEIYSELLSGGSMMIEARHSELDFLRNLSDEDLLNVFNSGNESFKVALLTRLPAAQRRRYSEMIAPEELRRILNYSLVCQEPSDDELKEALEQWKTSQGMQKPASVDIKMKFARLREVWSVFSRLEETLWMHHIVSLHPEIKESMMNEGPHMAFLTEWSAESFRKFCLSTKTRELAAAAKCLPFLTAQILNACGEVTRREIQDEMKNLGDQKLHQCFENFATSFDTFVEGEKKGVHTILKENIKGVA